MAVEVREVQAAFIPFHSPANPPEALWARVPVIEGIYEGESAKMPFTKEELVVLGKAYCLSHQLEPIDPYKVLQVNMLYGDQLFDRRYVLQEVQRSYKEVKAYLEHEQARWAEEIDVYSLPAYQQNVYTIMSSILNTLSPFSLPQEQ